MVSCNSGIAACLVLLAAHGLLLLQTVVPTQTAALSSSAGASSSSTTNKDKTIVFVRHGCTYMNEYLGRRGMSFGAPGFTDIFDRDTQQTYYRDSPLSPLGQRQAKALATTSLQFLLDCELIVTSPLTRALQTLHLGLQPHLILREKKPYMASSSTSMTTRVPILALPLAAERLYLISDVGRPVHELSQEFGYVDFTTGFGGASSDENAWSSQSTWWYNPPQNRNHNEWRPIGQGQRYACPGEPEETFHARMQQLYEWLVERPESKIAVVCHWGVIDWMLGVEFDNCQWQEVSLLSDIAPRAVQQQQFFLKRTP